MTQRRVDTKKGRLYNDTKKGRRYNGTKKGSRQRDKEG